MTSWVYFLRPIGMEGPVKIGCSAFPEERLALYIPWSPYPIEVAARIAGDAILERRFHARFRAQHTHHEWFAASADLTATIAAIRVGTFDVDALPAPQQLPRPRQGKWTPEKHETIGLRRSVEAVMRDQEIFPSDVVCGALGRLRFYVTADREADVQLVKSFIDAPASHGKPEAFEAYYSFLKLRSQMGAMSDPQQAAA